MYDWKAIQSELARLKFYTGKIDGIRGPRTDAAIIEFQKSVGYLAKTFGGTSTYFGPKSYAALMEKVPAASNEPPWLMEARKILNLHEGRDKAALRKWFDQKFSTLDPAVVAWCGAFVGTCILRWKSDEEVPANMLGARNWQSFGIYVKPQLGSVLSFWRGTKEGWQGHVGFYVGEDADTYHVLGGNQSNAVTIARLTKNRLLSSRWPSTYPVSNVTKAVAGNNVPLSENEA